MSKQVDAGNISDFANCPLSQEANSASDAFVSFRSRVSTGEFDQSGLGHKKGG